VAAHDLVPVPIQVNGLLQAWELNREELDEVLVAELDGRQLPAQDVLTLALPPAQALVELSATARMVVVGAQGHTRLGGLLIGSVSQHVARQSGCPVAVIREQASPSASDIVVGIDEGPDSQTALELAFTLAAARRARVIAVHGWHARYDERPYGRLPISGDVVDRVVEGQQRLGEALAPWRERYPDVVVELAAMPVHPSRLLADASQTAGLIVVGSRGRGAFKGLLLGSVSQSVLTQASCPVLIAR
jgi:nucleotide-binding universal stress UspA family protein